jgi:hypothetical protein
MELAQDNIQLYPMAHFGISDVKPSGFATTVLVEI